MGFIAKVLDTDSLEYDAEMAENVLNGITPDSTVRELYDRINSAKKVYEEGLTKPSGNA